MEHATLQAGIRAAQDGDRDGAYQLIRQALLEDAQHAPAWYYMSFLLDDIDRQREYLEWALTLDPDYAEAKAALEHLRIHQVLATARSIVSAEYRPVPRKLGDYLIEQGLLTAAQVEDALAELRAVQAKVPHGVVEEAKTKHMGDIFLQRGWLTPAQLARALLQQQHERSRSGQRPERLGEYLMAQNLVTSDQLGAALAEQARLRMLRKHARIGELLVRGGALAPAALNYALNQQRQDFASRYGNV